ncbi:MAG: bifunctional transcriptional activator/DNA repair enzyme AdaA [Isosphaeraceae bacterium]
MPPTHEMERAYLRGDATYDGLFLLGVRTTGVFCRPNCPARKPLPRNVEYFPNARAALAAGYRPCKRCRPAGQDDRPHWVRDLLAEVDASPDSRITGKDLQARGIDPATVRRYFLRHFGLTFQAYSRGRRLALAFDQIREGRSLDVAALGSGFDSHSGFRDAFARVFGVPPGRAGETDRVTLAWLPSPLGPLLAGATSIGVCLLEFTAIRPLEDQLRAVGKRHGLPVVPGTNPILDLLRAELSAYFAGTLRAFSVPLHLDGTPFQSRVWNELIRIPYAETISYEELARRVGNPAASRAVGRANGLNRIAIVIPCHRVVNKGGALGGYGGGLRRKSFLLDLERSAEPS